MKANFITQDLANEYKTTDIEGIGNVFILLNDLEIQLYISTNYLEERYIFLCVKGEEYLIKNETLDSFFACPINKSAIIHLINRDPLVIYFNERSWDLFFASLVKVDIKGMDLITLRS